MDLHSRRALMDATWKRYRQASKAAKILYRVLFHHFERFLTEYEGRFEKEYVFFQPIVKAVVKRYPDSGNRKC